jgi:CRISPR-associated endonuclease/helicase Cas3
LVRLDGMGLTGAEYGTYVLSCKYETALSAGKEAMSGVWAHSKNEVGERHDLVAHLTAVAAMAKKFAEPFDGGELAYWAGLWHDLGKFHPEFQEYLFACELNPGREQRGPDHKGAGATVAAKWGGLLAFLVAGHHGGLHASGDLQGRVRAWEAEARVQEALARARAGLSFDAPGQLRPPARVGMDRLQQELFLRMLFSCVVDADFLDTEAHFQPATAAARQGVPTIDALWPAFAGAMAEITGRRDDVVGLVRDEVYRACLAAGEWAPGLFRLTVPTGGGKTLAGLGFALRHALAHGMERVIVAVPYTSITEQTASVYRGVFTEAFGERAVLEHHSAIEPRRDSEEGEAEPQWGRLAAENWDAPLVVTTTVRLFESLFARTPSACRRLHRVANSIVILDEAQTLPVRLLAPILDVLRDLSAHYRTSVVLCTATQPALTATPGFEGLEDVREIAPEPSRLFKVLARVRYEWPAADESWDWTRVAEEMRSGRQALAVVNTKRDALALLDALGEGALHLSTLLCGAHRREVLAEVRRRLTDGEPCLLVSTQVVEAGVDLDFPLVLRAFGPLDRIVQAAGRCNREGRLTVGRVVVFRPADGGMPPVEYRGGARVAEQMANAGEVDPDDPETFLRYFGQLYRQVELDGSKVQEARAALDFPETAKRFRMIDDDGVGVLVRYGRGQSWQRFEALVERLRRPGGVTRAALRRAQPYIVNVRSRQRDEFVRAGLLEPIAEDLYVWRGGYHPVRGLTAGPRDVESLVI